jgi:hypothetical protein
LVRIRFELDRQTDERTWVLETIRYHQRRNAAATKSKQKRVVQPRTRKKRRKPKTKRKKKYSVTAK